MTRKAWAASAAITCLNMETGTQAQYVRYHLMPTPMQPRARQYAHALMYLYRHHFSQAQVHLELEEGRLQHMQVWNGVDVVDRVDMDLP
jgi:hypothetical protein